ncbi:MAG: IclR family transcriptional regulator [Oxalobacteraceae bacterium]|nr:MAG: IclR family transcriptional regulator [Oxalobacteraceae bacterium]
MAKAVAASNEDGVVPAYSAPALDKGLDIIELLNATELPLSQREIAQRLDRSVGEIYRMLTCLVRRGYISQVGDSYAATTKLFELAYQRPPTHRLLTESRPIMEKLADTLEQSCHLTVYGQGKQVVIAKVDGPTGMGFAVRVGAELEVLISASGRVLLAFQDYETRNWRISETLARRPEHEDGQTNDILSTITGRGYEAAPSTQVRGLFAVSFPILDTQGHAIAALTVPYAERIDQTQRTSITDVIEALGDAAHRLSQRVGGRVA